MQEGINQIEDTSDEKPLEYHVPDGRKEELAQPFLDRFYKWSAIDTVVIHHDEHEQAHQNEQ